MLNVCAAHHHCMSSLLHLLTLNRQCIAHGQNELDINDCLSVVLQRQPNSNNKAPRSSQRVSSPTRKRQCNGNAHDDLDNGAMAEQDMDAEAQVITKRSDSGRVDLQAVAGGI